MDSNGTGSGNCLPPNAQLGEYRLLEVIGEGGFGIVYRAHDPSLDREVAIKEYLPATMASRGGSSEVHVRSQHRGAFNAGLRSFINEARLLAKFSHPALVQVYRFFEGNGTAYMVMRCYEGQTLREFLENPTRSIDERWLKATLSPLLDVLEMLHEAECYHRDIAPDNVFLQSTGTPVLLDFGAARRIISDMTQALTMVLKPGFAPIEQYAEDGSMPQGAWTDIYQLGALIYQVITGKPPATSVARMIKDPITLLSPEQYPGYSSDFLEGVHEALRIKPQDRPQTIAEFKQLLAISDFSSSAFSRLPFDAEDPDFSTLDQATLSGITEKDPLYQITRPGPTRPPRVTTNSGEGAFKNPTYSEAAPVNPSPTPAPWTDRNSATAAPVVQREAAASTPAKDDLLALFEGTHPSIEKPTGAESEKNSPAKTAAPTPTSPQSSQKAPATAKPASSIGKMAVMGSILAGVLLVFAFVQFSSDSDNTGAIDNEAALWSETEKRPDAAALRAYLTAFPHGPHREEAQARLKALETPPQGNTEQARTQGPGTAQPAEQPMASAPPPPVAVQPEQPPLPKPEDIPPATASGALPPSPPQPPSDNVGNAPAEPVARGKVIFRVTPWGRIYVNRAGIGLTPPRMELDLPVGTHRVAVTNPAAPPMVWNIQVKKDEPVVLTHHFEPKPITDPSVTPPSEAE
jgi:serine/threonine protein kinase